MACLDFDGLLAQHRVTTPESMTGQPPCLLAYILSWRFLLALLKLWIASAISEVIGRLVAFCVDDGSVHEPALFTEGRGMHC